MASWPRPPLGLSEWSGGRGVSGGGCGCLGSPSSSYLSLEDTARPGDTEGDSYPRPWPALPCRTDQELSGELWAFLLLPPAGGPGPAPTGGFPPRCLWASSITVRQTERFLAILPPFS